MTMTSSLLLGFALGLRHATDADHVVAMGTIVTRDPHLKRAVRIGVFWGLGHTTTVLAIGLLVLFAKVRVPEHLIASMDLAVATMLVGLGLAALRVEHVVQEPCFAERLLLSPVRPLLVGVLHGLAGSAAMTLLALATLRDETTAFLYLGLFGAGTIAGMVGITACLAWSLRWVGSKGTTIPTWITRTSGILSVAAGMLLAYRTVAPLGAFVP